MNSKQRVLAAINYGKPDRLPLGFVWAYDFVLQNIAREMGFDMRDFESAIGSDMRSVQPRYCGPELICEEEDLIPQIWGNKTKILKYGDGFYEHSAYKPFETITDLCEAKKLRMPEPSWYDYSYIYEACEKHSDYAVFTGFPHYFDFLNGTGNLRGYQQVLMDIALEDPVTLYIFDKRFEFFCGVLEETLKAGKGQIDIIIMGEDLGTQSGPVISPASFRKLIAPRYEKAIALAHKYGTKAMLHSCGSVADILPDLVDMGLDILDAVQVDAKGMDIETLRRDFYGKIVLHGTMSVQNLLKNGSQEDIINEVRYRQEHYAEGGFIFAPTNGLQPDMPVRNFEAMLRAIGSID